MDNTHTPSGHDDSTPAEAGPAAGGPDELGLEDRLNRLSGIVEMLEADEVELDRALALFEEGIGHVREAERILAASELRVEELVRRAGGEMETRPFEGDAE